MVKNLPANARATREVDLIPGSGRFPGGENGDFSSIPVWKISGTEKPDGL